MKLDLHTIISLYMVHSNVTLSCDNILLWVYYI